MPDGYRAVAPHLAAQPGSELLIVSHGLPSIPLYAAQAALALGASRVDFASADAEQLALAERLGAHPIETDFAKPARTLSDRGRRGPLARRASTTRSAPPSRRASARA